MVKKLGYGIPVSDLEPQQKLSYGLGSQPKDSDSQYWIVRYCLGVAVQKTAGKKLYYFILIQEVSTFILIKQHERSSKDGIGTLASSSALMTVLMSLIQEVRSLKSARNLWRK
jgi:hypothetical protein